MHGLICSRSLIKALRASSGRRAARRGIWSRIRSSIQAIWQAIWQVLAICAVVAQVGCEGADEPAACAGPACDGGDAAAVDERAIAGTPAASLPDLSSRASSSSPARPWSGCSPACAAGVRSYLKASGTGAFDELGASVALSADGATLAVGAPHGDGAAAGAVYVFVRAGAAWAQQAQLRAASGEPGDQLGFRVALSADGATLAVGAPGEGGAGAVHVFARAEGAWRQQAHVRAPGDGAGGAFGASVALSGDGATLAAGAPHEDGAAAGAGAVHVFARGVAGWRQQAHVRASNAGAGDAFGASVALSGDGGTLAAGAWGEDGASAGTGGDPASDAAPDAGAVYVFARGGAGWRQQAYVKASNAGAADLFGYSVALSGDGATLAVGAALEDGGAAGVGGDEENDAAIDAGAVYVFARGGAGWRQQAYVKASNTAAGAVFGYSVALAGDGATLAVGAYAESSAASGPGGAQADRAAPESGAVYLFGSREGTGRRGAGWRQQAYAKAAGAGAGASFGSSVALAADGATLAIGAMGEVSAATGVGGDQREVPAPSSGAVYVLP